MMCYRGNYTVLCILVKYQYVSIREYYLLNVIFQRLGIKRNLHGEHAVLRRMHSLFQVCIKSHLVQNE